MIQQIDDLSNLEAALVRVHSLSGQLLEAIGAVRVALPTNLPKSRAHRMAAITAAVTESSGYTLDDLRTRRRDAIICSARFCAMRALEQEGFSDSEIETFLHRKHGAMANMRSKERP